MSEQRVYFREFEDGTYELGVLEDHGSYKIMDVGDFAYGLTLDLSHWTFIGDL